MKKIKAQTNATGWWDDYCRVLSPFLWLPTVQALKDMGQSYANLEYSESLRNAWFGSEVYSLPTSAHRQGKSSSGITNPERESLRSRKIRIYPDAGQRTTLSHWFSAARYIHNMTLEYIAKGNQPDWLGAKRFLLKKLPEWTKDVPYQIKAVAVRDACVSCRTSSRNGGKPGFKARGDAKQSIFIPKTSINSRGVYTRLLGSMKHSEEIPAPEGDCRLTRENQRWFVCVPVKITELPETSGRVVSLDPGIRTFMTFYSLDSCGKIGTGAFSRIYSLCRHIDDINSRMKDTCHRRRYKMKKAVCRMQMKAVNLIEEMQHKAAVFLVKNFDVIALPEYRTDFTDRIASASAREMITSAHRGFQDFLRAKARECGRKVIAQNEEYTSGVCSWSGEAGVSGRIIRDGEIAVDRDYNGARGIFLRALRESAVQPPV